jgi:hypothetical protein
MEEHTRKEPDRPEWLVPFSAEHLREYATDRLSQKKEKLTLGSELKVSEQSPALRPRRENRARAGTNYAVEVL